MHHGNGLQDISIMSAPVPLLGFWGLETYGFLGGFWDIGVLGLQLFQEPPCQNFNPWPVQGPVSLLSLGSPVCMIAVSRILVSAPGPLGLIGVLFGWTWLGTKVWGQGLTTHDNLSKYAKTYLQSGPHLVSRK